MKLVHPDLEGHIIKDEIQFTEWIIESPKLFSKYVQKFIMQKEEVEQGYILSHEEEILDMSKIVEVILDPFHLDFNEKKIINILYKELAQLAYEEEMYLETQELIKFLYKYLLKLEHKTDYILRVSEDIDISLLFKAANIQHEMIEDNFFEVMVRYIKIIQTLGIQLAIFINIRSYLLDKQFLSLIQELSYIGIKALFIENQERSCIPGIFRYIIDKDECEIF